MKISPTVVELTGARGVGKSTVADFIRAEFAKRQAPLGVIRPPNLRTRIGLEFASVPARLRMERLWRSWGLHSYEDIGVFKRRFRRYQLHSHMLARESGIFLLDEGLFQLMMMIRIRTGREIEQIARSLSELVPMPDIVVSVEAPEEAVNARRKQRGNARDLLKLQMSPRSREGLRSMQAYLRSLPNGTGTKAIIIENAEFSKLESVAEDVADEILGGYGGELAFSTPATMTR